MTGRISISVLTLMLGVSVASVYCQTSQAKDRNAPQPPQEQTSFGSEADVKKPMTIPDDALVVLTDSLSRGTTNCIKNVAGLTPEQVPASWFVGSEIHLSGPDEIDLIVQPSVDARAKPGSECLLGAHVVPFWVLRKSRRYELLLATVADSLEVLESRTNAYRDIQTVGHTAVSSTELLFKFYIAQYQMEKRTDNN